MAYVAYHFHWPREEILALPHPERHRWVKEISGINRKINEASQASVGPPLEIHEPDPEVQFRRGSGGGFILDASDALRAEIARIEAGIEADEGGPEPEDEED